jgi:hypothetical protein
MVLKRGIPLLFIGSEGLRAPRECTAKARARDTCQLKMSGPTLGSLEPKSVPSAPPFIWMTAR